MTDFKNKINKIYKILENPFVYRLAQVLLAPGLARLLKPLHNKIFSLKSRSVLDVGCGPHLNTPEPDGLLVGIDVNESYIQTYSGGYVDTDPKLVFNPPKNRHRLGFVASADYLPFVDGSFDEARSNLIFHHLPDEVAFNAIKEMIRCVRPSGRVIIVDAVWPLRAWMRPIPWLLLSLDRGCHVRSQEEMLRLCQEACDGLWESDRVTGTYTGVEYLALQYTKR